jgi:biotin transport system substrate-specific component
MTHATIAGCFRPSARGRAWVYDAALVLGGSLLIAAGARVSVWIGPVPITGQTFAVLLLGALLGSRRGAVTAGLYLLEGACGLPVFARGGGAGYLAGPTGGYLLGFVLAAWLTGWLAERGWDRRWVTTAGAMALGSAVILILGALRLAAFIGPQAALYEGLVVFLPGDAFKVALASILLPAGWRLLRLTGRP